MSLVINSLADGDPTFNKRFGTLGSDGTYQIFASWQTILGNCGTVGQIAGLLVSSIILSSPIPHADVSQLNGVCTNCIHTPANSMRWKHCRRFAPLISYPHEEHY